MTHEKIVAVAGKWLKKHEQNILIPNCSLVLTELVAATTSGEIPDVIGWCSWISVLIEVKTSRADYFRDSLKPFRAYGNLSMGELKYYICPTGMISIDEVPEYWGLLYIDESHNITIEKVAVACAANLKSERALLLSKIRRDKIK